jgi:hypothetical protein
MHKTFTALMFSAMILTGCDALTGKVTPESVAKFIADKCGIVVTLADISTLITGDATASVLADKVCTAFNTQKAQGKFGASGAAAGVVIVDGKEVHFTTK